MPLTSGTRIGSFEVLRSLGAGGMGEVYRARDTRLDREVAIKVLPESFATDPDRLMRFTREAKTLATLNHPNIAAIYGIEPHGSTSALVMELVEGEDLSSRISHGPLPLGEALAIARQIADALEAAHEAGVIHRDLKPANIKVRDDGTVKVLDFGLAKLAPAEAAPEGAGGLVNSPTITSPALTAMGLILGTAAYMAPEQAKGRAVDRRADVWAFGVIVHEMLTGRRLFAGEDVSDTLAAVLTREPDWTALPANTPASIRRLLTRCLARDRRARLDSMTAARLEIEEAIATPETVSAAPVRRGTMLMVVASAVVGLAVGTTGARWLWPPGTSSAPAVPVVSSIAAAPDAVSAFTYGFALSPDGTTLVYSGRRNDGRRLLWKRRLDDSRSEPMQGTDDATYPFWSPDSRQVGFFADEKLKTMPIGGGPVQSIAAAAGIWPRGSWSKGDEILFSTTLGASFGIQRVPASGGRPSKLPLGDDAFEPQWLPDGRKFLFLRALGDKSQLAAASVDSPTAPVTIMEDEDYLDQDDTSHPRYSEAGFLVFNRAGVLSRQKFNTATLKTEGPVVRIGDPAGTPRAWFAVSVAGEALVALNPPAGEVGGTPGDPVSRLLWVNRSGHIVGQVGPPARYWTLKLSRDGRQVLVNSDDYASAIDTTTQLRTRIGKTFGAVWMPGNAEVLYRGAKALFARRASGEGEPRQIVELKERPVTPWDVSPDGRTIVASARRHAEASLAGLWMVSTTDGSMRPLLSTDNDERHASFSPDGHWVAYSSKQTGRFEVYVRQATGDARAVRLSADGGTHPLWRGDGQEIFFMSPTDEVIAVDVASLARTGAAGARKVLFRMVTNDLGREAFNSFGVSPDGQRFLLNVPGTPEPVTLIQLAAR